MNERPVLSSTIKYVGFNMLYRLHINMILLSFFELTGKTNFIIIIGKLNMFLLFFINSHFYTIRSHKKGYKILTECPKISLGLTGQRKVLHKFQILAVQTGLYVQILSRICTYTEWTILSSLREFL